MGESTAPSGGACPGAGAALRLGFSSVAWDPSLFGLGALGEYWVLLTHKQEAPLSLLSPSFSEC